jgi:hypothetical protein
MNTATSAQVLPMRPAIVSVAELRKDIEQRIAQLWLDVQKIAPADYPAGRR